MRRLFLASLLTLLAAAGLVVLIETDPGYVLISYGLTTVESSLWVALLLLLLLNILGLYLWRFLRGLLAGRGSLGRWWLARRSEKGRRLTLQGVLNYFRGDWRGARRTLLQSVAASPEPAVNYLLAARSSAHLGEADRADAYYLELEAGPAADPLLVAVSRAGDLLHTNQHRRALDALERVKSEASASPLVLGLLREAYRGVGDWRSLVALLPQIRKSGAAGGEAYRALAIEAHVGLLRESTDAQTLAKAWLACPEDIRQMPDVIAAYGGALLQRGGDPALEKLLMKALKRHWRPDLVRLYGLTAGVNPNRQLQRAESWLQTHGADAELLRCLGRLSLRNRLWGKARDYFESSHRLQPSAETCAELARLLFRLGEREQSARFYREGLLLNTGDLPELPLPR